MKEYQQMVRNFLDDRPVMRKNNTHKRVVELLHGEVDEVRGAGPEELAWELADVVFFVMTLANMHDIDLGEALREKTAFNLSRFPSSDFQEGDYSEARLKGKLRESIIKKDFDII